MDDALRQALSVLGVSAGTTWPAVQQAHKDLVKVWHPDRFENEPRLRERALEQLTVINAAFDVCRRAFQNGMADPLGNPTNDEDEGTPADPEATRVYPTALKPPAPPEPVAAASGQEFPDEVLPAAAAAGGAPRRVAIVVGMLALGVAGGFALRATSAEPAQLKVLVTTEPQTRVYLRRAKPPGAAASPELVDLGKTPVTTLAQAGDTLLLRNPQACIDEEMPLANLERARDGTVTIDKTFGQGDFRIAVLPPTAKFEVFCGETALPISRAWPLYEGVKHLELRSPVLSEPRRFDVTIVAGQRTSVTMDLYGHLR